MEWDFLKEPPGDMNLGVYAALCAGTAFLTVGHRSVYASQKLGLAKTAGLEVPLGVPIAEVRGSVVRIRKESLTERLHNWLSRRRRGQAGGPLRLARRP
jgi:hypothetical protein